MTQVLAAISAIREIILAARDVLAFVEANKKEKWFEDSVATFQGLRASKTPEEMREVVKKLRDLWRGA